MNYTKLLPLVLFVGIVGVVLLSRRQENDAILLEAPTPVLQIQPENSVASPPVDIVGQPATIIADTQKYIPYNDTILETTGGRRVLFFYANWCPTCIPADKSIMAGATSIPDGVTVIRVNYNDTETSEAEKALAQQYGVTYQHTYVEIDGAGKEVQKWNGGGLEELLERLQ